MQVVASTGSWFTASSASREPVLQKVATVATLQLRLATGLPSGITMRLTGIRHVRCCGPLFRAVATFRHQSTGGGNRFARGKRQRRSSRSWGLPLDCSDLGKSRPLGAPAIWGRSRGKVWQVGGVQPGKAYNRVAL